MYPQVNIALNADGSESKIAKILASPWKTDPKSMGRVYRFYASQENWQGGSSVSAKYAVATLNILYSQLEQFHKEGKLTPYQFYKCHGIRPSKGEEDVQKCQALFSSCTSSEQVEKITKYNGHSKEMRDRLFPNDLKIVSKQGTEYFGNKFLILGLLSPSLKEQAVSKITKKEELEDIRINFSNEFIEIIIAASRGEDIHSWGLEKLAKALQLESCGYNGIKACSAIKDKITKFLIHPETQTISKEELPSTLEKTHTIDNFELQKCIGKLLNHFYVGKLPIFVDSYRESLIILVKDIEVLKELDLFLNPCTNSLVIDAARLLHYLSNNLVLPFQGIDSLHLVNEGGGLELTPESAQIIREHFPNLKCLALTGSLLKDAPPASLLTEGIPNVFIVGPVNLPNNSIRVKNLIFEDPQNPTQNPNYAIAEFAINASNKFLRIANQPDLPDDFFRLLTRSETKYKEWEIDNVPLSSLQFIPKFSKTSLKSLVIKNCPELTARDLLKLDFFTNLNGLTLENQKFSADLVFKLFTRLNHIILKNAELNSVFPVLYPPFLYPPFPRLDSVTLESPQLPADLVKALKYSAKCIYTTDSDLTYDEVGVFLQMKKGLGFTNLLPNDPRYVLTPKNSLTTLSLHNTNNPLRFIHPVNKLLSLDLQQCFNINERSFNWEKLKDLKYLDLSDCQDITDFSIIGIAHLLEKLETLKISNLKNVTPQAVEFLLRYCKNLLSISLRGCDQVTPATLNRWRNEYPHIHFFFPKLSAVDKEIMDSSKEQAPSDSMNLEGTLNVAVQNPTFAEELPLNTEDPLSMFPSIEGDPMIF